jgi:hypothetical protein
MIWRGTVELVSLWMSLLLQAGDLIAISDDPLVFSGPIGMSPKGRNDVRDAPDGASGCAVQYYAKQLVNCRIGKVTMRINQARYDCRALQVHDLSKARQRQIRRLCAPERGEPSTVNSEAAAPHMRIVRTDDPCVDECLVVHNTSIERGDVGHTGRRFCSGAAFKL